MAQLYTPEQNIERMKTIHPSYDFSQSVFINYKTKIIYYCPLHGEKSSFPQTLLEGKGCKNCGQGRPRYNFIKFIEDMKILHNDKYDYSKLEHLIKSKKQFIICKKHGEFEQSLAHHQNGVGCPVCGFNVSKIEMKLHDFIKSLGYKIIVNKKDIIAPYELDIYIPSLNKAIEFNGEYWHYNERNPNRKPKGYHGMKSQLCRDKKIRLLHIREDLWEKNENKMKNVINAFLAY
jgi:hypothetical protein